MRKQISDIRIRKDKSPLLKQQIQQSLQVQGKSTTPIRRLPQLRQQQQLVKEISQDQWKQKCLKQEIEIKKLKSICKEFQKSVQNIMQMINNLKTEMNKLQEYSNNSIKQVKFEVIRKIRRLGDDKCVLNKCLIECKEEKQILRQKYEIVNINSQMQEDVIWNLHNKLNDFLLKAT